MSSLNRRRVTTRDTSPQLNADPFLDKIFQTTWKLKKEGKSDYTIANVKKALTRLSHNCNLDNPEQVKGFIANLDRKNGYKRQLTYSYQKYTETHSLEWNRPIYYQTAKLPKIPLETEIHQIISNASKKLATAISISKDTGLRPIELTNLTLRNIDLNKGIIYPETAKHGTPRALKIKKTTLNLLNNYIETKNLNINDTIFGTWNSQDYGKYFRQSRNKTAKKLAKPSIKTIRLYDLRHYFATMLYRHTRDILYVKQQLGHNNIKNTLIYTQLLVDETDDHYICKVAQTVEKSKQLIEAGFEYVTDQDGIKLFRKRK